MGWDRMMGRTRVVRSLISVSDMPAWVPGGEPRRERRRWVIDFIGSVAVAVASALVEGVVLTVADAEAEADAVAAAAVFASMLLDSIVIQDAVSCLVSCRVRSVLCVVLQLTTILVLVPAVLCCG